MTSPVTTGNKKLVIALIIAGIIVAGIASFVFFTQPGGPGTDVRSPSPPGGSPVLTTPVATAIPVTREQVTQPVVTVTTALVTTTTPRATSLLPTPAATPETFSPGGGSEPAVVAVPFTFSVSPVTARTRPGETLSYTLRIDGGQGQTEPIHFTLKASALFFTQTYELGDEQPPFPKTVTYEFVVPGNVPAGITITGVITATGAGQTREQTVTLTVE
jgi:hypothetical protein